MNSKLQTIKHNNTTNYIKYFYNDKPIQWKNSRYLWCSNCKTKLKYCDTCKSILNDQIMLIKAKQNATKYIISINNRLEQQIEPKIKQLKPLAEKYQQQYLDHLQKEKERIEQIKQEQLKQEQDRIQQEYKIKLKEIDLAWEELHKTKKIITPISPNYLPVKIHLKGPVNKILKFYDLRYCVANNKSCNDPIRHMHIANNKINCQDIISNNRLDVFGHYFIQFAQHISRLFCIPLKFHVIYCGKYTRLIHKLTNEDIDLAKGLTPLMTELFICLNNTCNMYFNTPDFNQKTKKCIIYPIIFIRQILLLLLS